MRSNSFLGSFLSSIVLFRTLLGFLVGICLTLSFSTKAMTEGEFLMEMEAHILRVVRMGRHLLESSDFRAQFPEIAKLDKEQVLGFLARHDAAKIRQDRSTLRAYNLPRVAEGSMAERLGSLHGVNFGELSGAEREQVQALVQRLNDADRAIGRTYLHENGLLDRKGRLTNRARVLLEFEKALDTGDRYFASVDALKSSGKTEFGKAMKPASEFLGDSLGGKVAHYMETSPKFNYGEVTRGLKASTYKLTRIATGKSVDFFLVREGNLSHPPVPLRARLYRVYGPKGKYDLKGAGRKPLAHLVGGCAKCPRVGF